MAIWQKQLIGITLAALACALVLVVCLLWFSGSWDIVQWRKAFSLISIFFVPMLLLLAIALMPVSVYLETRDYDRITRSVVYYSLCISGNILIYRTLADVDISDVSEWFLLGVLPGSVTGFTFGKIQSMGNNRRAAIR